MDTAKLALHRSGITGLLTCLAVAPALACGDDTGASDAMNGDAAIEPSVEGTTDGDWPTNGWTESTPAEQGMNADALEGAYDYAYGPEMNTQGVVIIRNGHIVSERYAPDRDKDSWATSWSMGKTFAATTVAIAIDEGLIESVDVPLTDYYPQWLGTNKERIRLEHLLRMATGLDWVEDYTGAGGSHVSRMAAFERDSLAYALTATEPTYAPGTRFNYSSGDSMLMAGILEQATGMSAGEYAKEKLLAPLGMADAQWWTDAVGNTLTYCCVDTTTRNYAKLGLLYLRGGEWDGQQIIPASWVEAAVEGGPAWNGYGYQIWLTGQYTSLPDELFAFIGVDSQLVYVLPSEDLIVVRNSIYDKYDGPAIGDPTIDSRLPTGGRGARLGTKAPRGEWDDVAFMQPIIDAIE